MYVNAFWFGVFVTIFVEIATILGLAAWGAWKKVNKGFLIVVPGVISVLEPSGTSRWARESPHICPSKWWQICSMFPTATRL